MLKIYSNNNLLKFASSSYCISRFQSAVNKGKNSKNSRKSIEVKTHYKSNSKKVSVDVDEFTKSGHKHRHYILENISQELYKKIESLISAGKWGMFFSIVNKYRSN